MFPECIYNSKIAARGPRPRAEPVRRARRIMPNRSASEDFGTVERLHEDQDLNAKTKRTAEISLGETGDDLDGNAERSTGTRIEKTDEEIDEEADEEVDDETDDETDEPTDEATDEDDEDEEETRIGDNGNLAGTDDNPTHNVSSAKSRCSNFTEPSFARGSFLPPFRASFLQQQKHRSIADGNSDFILDFDVRELWIEAAVKNHR